MEKFYSVTELANDFGVTPRAIRFYETKGLLCPQRAGATRVFTHKDHARLTIILRGKRLGFSLAQIKDYFDLYETDLSQDKQNRMLLVAVETRIEDLEARREDLETALSELHELKVQINEHL